MRRTRQAMVRAAWTAALALAAVPACGDVDGGSQPFAGTTLFTDPAGAYQLRLLEPPWIVVPLDGETIFLVPPSDATTSSDLSDALYSLHVGTVDDDPQDAASIDASAAEATRPAGSDPPLEDSVETASGSSGYEVTWEQSVGSFERDAFVTSSGKATYRLQFTAKVPIADDDMVMQMIASFEIL